jgi:hypothetical protein
MAAGSIAGAQTNTFTVGTAYTTPALTGFSTTSAQMAGMVVSWRFAGNATVFSSAWGNIGGGFFGVSGLNGFGLRMEATDNTFTSSWELTNSSQQRLDFVQMSGAQGRTLFDCGWTGTACANNGNGTGAFGTAGSADGWSHQRTGGTFTGTVLGTYSNRVGLGAAPDVGDLFESLLITFEGSMGAGLTYTFRADTDSSPSGQDTPMPTIPEPSTYLLMGTGLIGLFSLRRKMKV